MTVLLSQCDNESCFKLSSMAERRRLSRKDKRSNYELFLDRGHLGSHYLIMSISCLLPCRGAHQELAKRKKLVHDPPERAPGQKMSEDEQAPGARLTWQE